MSHVVYLAITNKKENNNDNLYKTMYNTMLYLGFDNI